MPYELRYTSDAEEALNHLKAGGKSARAKLAKVVKALNFLKHNPRHRGLSSHLYDNFPGHPRGKVWNSYVENQTPSAWRIYWMYGPNEIVKGTEVAVITVLEVRSHR
ncbi:hypothetical protein ACWC3X_38395 [Streptomyces populi]